MARVIIEKKMPKPKLSLEKKLNVYGYLFVAPIIIGYLVLYLPAIIRSLQFSFSDIKYDTTVAGGLALTPVGFQNFVDALAKNRGEFVKLLFDSTIALLPQIIIVLLFAFFMANLLNQNFKGRTATRVIFFLPVIMSTGIMSYVENLSSMVDSYQSQEKLDVGAEGGFKFSMLSGVLMQALDNEELTMLIMDAISGIYGVITSAGVQMLVFLSGLQSISTNMYEAAKVEGATGWETFWKISFPMISPLILVNLIYTVIDLFLGTNNEAIKYINESLTSFAGYAQASAMSWMYTLVILIFVGLVFLLVRKLIVYQD